MARNRASEDREAKRGEILEVATRMFLDQGFEATSMQALASAAGITTTTIYWYFDDKDALLVAVIDRALAAGMRGLYASPPATLPERLLALTELLGQSERLIAAVHARAPHSEAVAEWHERFHRNADRALIAEVREHLTERDPGREILDASLVALPRIWSFTIEGMIGHDVPEAERRAICETMVAQLDALPSSPPLPAQRAASSDRVRPAQSS